MLGSNILDIAVGVVFIYLLLSLICSAANEAIASLLAKRSSNLFEGIKNLLNDPVFTGLAQQLYGHGMIDGISRDASNPNKPNQRPSYIPAAHFALAMIDILGSRGVVAAAHGERLTAAEKADDEYLAAQSAALAKPDDQALKVAEAQAKVQRDETEQALLDAQKAAATVRDQAAQAAAQNPTDKACASAASQARDAVAAADAAVNMLEARRAAIKAAANPKDQSLVRNASNTLEAALATARALAANCPDPLGNLQAAVNHLPTGHTRESLQVLLDKTRRDVADATQHIAAFEKNIENWFNDSMARIGGWYKRWTQKCLFALAVAVVLIANADTIKLVSRLSSDAALRSGLVAGAEASARNLPQQQNADAGNGGQTKIVIDVLKNEAAGIHIPLGIGEWTQEWKNLPEESAKEKLNSLLTTRSGWASLASKLLGLLFSVLAISLGAPFWFDTLSKIANVRSAGTPGETKANARATSTSAVPNKV